MNKKRKVKNTNNFHETKSKQDVKTTIKQLFIKSLKWISACLVIYLLIFIAIMIFTYFENKTHGYDTSDIAVNNYVTAIIENDGSAMKKCINTESNSYLKMYESQKTYANLIENMKIDIDTKNIEIESSNYDDLTKIAETLSPDTKIENAQTNRVYVSYTETIDDDKFDGIIQYIIITYQIENKWYIFSIDQNDTVTKLANGNTYMQIGNKILGTMSLNKQWTSTNMSPAENTKSMISYKSPSGNAMISLNAINSELSIDDYIKNFTNSLSELNIKYVIEDKKLNSTTTKCIKYLTKNNNNEETYQFTWLFEDPMRDGYIHCITLDCTKTGIYATNYIDTYVY